MFRTLIAFALVAFASASCPSCLSACSAATGTDCSATETAGCAYEESTSCGCNSCDDTVTSYRIGCGLSACPRRLADTADLEEAAPEMAAWGRRRRRHGHRPHRHNPHRHNPHRHNPHVHTPYPTPYPTPAPTGILQHSTCARTMCMYSNGQTDIYSTGGEKFHCEKVGNGCKCVCHSSLRCALRHHHTTGYKKTFEHC